MLILKYAMAIAFMGLLATPTLGAESEDELRTFQALIDFFQPGITPSGNATWTPQYLQSVKQKLEDAGFVTRQQAFDLVRESLRAGVDPDLLPDITTIGGALAQVMGRNSAYGFAGALVQALSRGYQAIVDFGLETHTLDAGDTNHLRSIALGGDRYGLEHDAVAAMMKKVKAVLATIQQQTQPSSPPKDCSANSAENIRQFTAVLTASHARSPGPAAEQAQGAVISLCQAGKTEHEAFDDVMSILRGSDRKR